MYTLHVQKQFTILHARLISSGMAVRGLDSRSTLLSITEEVSQKIKLHACDVSIIVAITSDYKVIYALFFLQSCS